MEEHKLCKELVPLGVSSDKQWYVASFMGELTSRYVIDMSSLSDSITYLDQISKNEEIFIECLIHDFVTSIPFRKLINPKMT